MPEVSTVSVKSPSIMLNITIIMLATSGDKVVPTFSGFCV